MRPGRPAGARGAKPGSGAGSGAGLDRTIATPEPGTTGARAATRDRRRPLRRFVPQSAAAATAETAGSARYHRRRGEPRTGSAAPVRPTGGETGR
ncbi:hypothetical protein GCM10027570_22070 [Streptomonospora sediminis]